MPQLRRIDAAKQLFNAFVTRTQAYKLHHSFGLTLFDDRTTIKLNIVNNMEEFEVSSDIVISLFTSRVEYVFFPTNFVIKLIKLFNICYDYSVKVCLLCCNIDESE